MIIGLPISDRPETLKQEPNQPPTPPEIATGIRMYVSSAWPERLRIMCSQGWWKLMRTKESYQNIFHIQWCLHSSTIHLSSCEPRVKYVYSKISLLQTWSCIKKFSLKLKYIKGVLQIIISEDSYTQNIYILEWLGPAKLVNYYWGSTINGIRYNTCALNHFFFF